MEKALIQPYGKNELVESTTRTNTASWLGFHQDEIVRNVEERIAKITNTHVLQGENLQILRYADRTQRFSEHQDFFDPKLDPPESFEPGGNRIITVSKKHSIHTQTNHSQECHHTNSSYNPHTHTLTNMKMNVRAPIHVQKPYRTLTIMNMFT